MSESLCQWMRKKQLKKKHSEFRHVFKDISLCVYDGSALILHSGSETSVGNISCKYQLFKRSTEHLVCSLWWYYWCSVINQCLSVMSDSWRFLTMVLLVVISQSHYSGQYAGHPVHRGPRCWKILRTSRKWQERWKQDWPTHNALCGK